MCEVKGGTFGGASALSIDGIDDLSKRKDYEDLVKLINESFSCDFIISGNSISHK
jgi:hypothetical protein